MTNVLISILLRTESGPEAIVGGIVSGIAIVIFGAIYRGIKKVTSKKNDADKIK